MSESSSDLVKRLLAAGHSDLSAEAADALEAKDARITQLEQCNKYASEQIVGMDRKIVDLYAQKAQLERENAELRGALQTAESALATFCHNEPKAIDMAQILGMVAETLRVHKGDAP